MQFGDLVVDDALLWTVLVMLGLLVFGVILFVMELTRRG